jgi:16S rRNA (cytosine1402-N4)-methyltransferase
MSFSEHTSVLLHESIEGLHITKGDIVVDGTVGLGGHAHAIAQRIGKEGVLFAIDLDADALSKAQKRLKDAPSKIFFCEGSFKDVYDHVHEKGMRKVHAILFDLGWNTTQLESGRGFSFHSDDPLVMTYMKNVSPSQTASHIVNTWHERDLADILRTLGEERHAGRIAHAIVLRRRITPIETAKDLADVVASAVPVWYRNGRLHPATKTFQALRIVVNSELSAIEEGVREALAVLAEGGRLAIITFHSLEDGLVKRLFKEAEKNGKAHVITKKPIVPSKEEIARNPRARSAKLRILEKQQL